MSGPRLSVFICGIQRSGTWLLAHLLRSSGVAGSPAEYFDRDEMRRFRSDWAVTTDGEYVDRVLREGTTPNGVFATKLMWNARDDLLFRLRRLTRDYDGPDLDVIANVFPNPRFVWVRRRDVVAQAVSWARAAQTGQFAAHQEPTGSASFDFDQIDGLMSLVLVQDGVWRRWFAAHRIEPMPVTYEELCEDGVGATRELLSALGLEPRPGARILTPPELVKQADEVNAEWIARYRALAAGLDV